MGACSGGYHFRSEACHQPGPCDASLTAGCSRQLLVLKKSVPKSLLNDDNSDENELSLKENELSNELEKFESDESLNENDEVELLVRLKSTLHLSWPNLSMFRCALVIFF